MPDQPQQQPQPQVTVFQPPRPAAPAPTPVHGRQSSVEITPAQALYKRDFDRLTAENPFRDQNVIISKNPETGVLSVRPRGDGRPSATPDAAPSGQPQPGAQPGQQPPPAPQAQPASVEGNKLKVGAYELSESDIASLMAEKAQRDSRAANTPQDAASFALDLPADFKLPEGVAEFRWADDPVGLATIGQLKEWAHVHQLDQPAFSGLLALYASHQAAEQQKFAEVQRAEIGKLGAAAPTRVDAVNTWLRSMVGDQLAESLRRTLITADQIKAYETMISRWTSQGISGNPAAARDGEHGRGPQKVDEATYQKMSFAERQTYAAQFDQSKFR